MVVTCLKRTRLENDATRELLQLSNCSQIDREGRKQPERVIA